MKDYGYRIARHPETGWKLVHLEYCDSRTGRSSSATFTPDVGANLFQFAVDGTEYLYDLFESPLNAISLLGTPVLYPSPNRVRDSQFSFDGHLFTFEPNDGTRFLHGLVRHEEWELLEPVITAEGVSATAIISFVPGTSYFSRFPIHNVLKIKYTLKSNAIRFDFAVINQDASRRLPFGLAIHPYFAVHEPRESIRIEVPAQKWMPAVDLLPTGKLADMAQGPADISKPTSLSDLDLDDVLWGMQSSSPATVYYDSLGKKLTLRADEAFTHAVVYTPQGKPYLCIENQTCSTDAHNLYARDLQEAAHLIILEPGQSLSTWVEFQVSDQA